MKLRVRGDSLRLRVVRAELDVLAGGGEVEEHLRFPDGNALVYRLRIGPHERRFEARFEEGVVTVGLPCADARRWFAPDETGVQGDLDLPGGARLSLLVEKDFACLTARPGEDDSDAFPRQADGSPARC
jgi:hypothetical protein